MTKAVLTGHSKGLGAALADELVARGIPILGVARTRRDDLGDDDVEQHQVDLADSDALGRWIDAGHLQRFVDAADTVLLINNAGLLQPIAPMENQGLEDIARAVSLNVSAALVLSSALVKTTPKARDRRILHVSSGAGRKAYAGWSVYCATKAAMDHHARCVAMDATPRLRISAIAPGVIDTEMQTEIRASSLENFPDRKRFDAMHREGTLQTPREVAVRAIEFLLSDGFGAEPVVDLGPKR